MVRKVCLAAVAALLLAAPQTASAYWPWGGGFGYGFGDGYGIGIWNNASYFNGGIYASPLPYYAQYPPVYYAPHIQARHYGASPYAWYAGQEPITYVNYGPAYVPPPPLMVMNPYVGPKPAAAAATSGDEIVPVAIENPFLASTNR
jgi:hypothetical protein